MRGSPFFSFRNKLLFFHLCLRSVDFVALFPRRPRVPEGGRVDILTLVAVAIWALGWLVKRRVVGASTGSLSASFVLSLIRFPRRCNANSEGPPHRRERVEPFANFAQEVELRNRGQTWILLKGPLPLCCMGAQWPAGSVWRRAMTDLWPQAA